MDGYISKSMVQLGILCRSLAAFSRQFVPPHAAISESDLLLLENFIAASQKLFVITGAGISTESGIKDYRSERVGLFATSASRPTNYGDFLRNASVRQRFWARNTTAWPLFSSFKPNFSHKFFATLEHQSRLHWLVTQNVDNLHHKAGSRRLTELHGTVYSVICLSCKQMVPRDELQERILAENPGWSPTPEGFAPDADVFVAEESVKSFKTPHCEGCGGVLKPDVVFFGENVPRRRVDDINQCLEGADACMVVGSSLDTFSSYRHVCFARQELGLPLLIMNIGRTRVDHLGGLKISGRCGEAFKLLTERNNI